jgi:hypothetical protein
MPFSLFVSSYRRKKILDAMMSKDKSKREVGEKIMTNYKKQIAEKMAREKAEKGDSMMSSSSKGKSKKGDESDKHSSIKQKFNEGEAMEPEVLLSILHRKSKK